MNLTSEQMEARKAMLKKIYLKLKNEREAMNITHRNENMRIIHEAINLGVLFDTPTSVEE